jgi:hypothetical protein
LRAPRTRSRDSAGRALYPDPPPTCPSGRPRVAPGGCRDRRRPILPSGQHRPRSRFTGSPPHAPGCRGPGSAATAAPPGPRHGRRFAPTAGARATPDLRNPSGCFSLDVGGGLPAASRVPAWSSTRRSPARLPPPAGRGRPPGREPKAGKGAARAPVRALSPPPDCSPTPIAFPVRPFPSKASPLKLR